MAFGHIERSNMMSHRHLCNVCTLTACSLSSMALIWCPTHVRHRGWRYKQLLSSWWSVLHWWSQGRPNGSVCTHILEESWRIRTIYILFSVYLGEEIFGTSGWNETRVTQYAPTETPWQQGYAKCFVIDSIQGKVQVVTFYPFRTNSPCMWAICPAAITHFYL